jgi:hypothetical protein
MDREVAHPLQLADHSQRRHDDAQVAGNGLLQRQQGERGVLDPLAGVVDDDVGRDHPLGHLGIAVQESLGGIADGGLHLVADAGQVTEDGVELLVERFAHAATLGAEDDRTGPRGERPVNTP